MIQAHHLSNCSKVSESDLQESKIWVCVEKNMASAYEYGEAPNLLSHANTFLVGFFFLFFVLNNLLVVLKRVHGKGKIP
jgi:hypothetical protein